MLQIDKKLNHVPELNWELFAPRERTVILDIETTGFKASRSSLYLIGIVEYDGTDWKMHQFFAETKADEIHLIHAFGEFLRDKKKGQDHLILLTYNGDGFDIPYLREVEREYGESGLFRDTVSFDLYKAAKPFKKIAGLDDLKLKTVEKLCGVSRNDPYSGGDLIAVYEEYLRLDKVPKGGCEDNELNEALKNKCLECLLLHNEEDIIDMLPAMKILAYRYLFDGCFDFEKAEILSLNGKKILDLSFKLKESLPVELYRETEQTVLSVPGSNPYLMEITTCIETGELRLYYPDYKNYYYLPAEDMAIHQSVGEFVEKKNRIKATASTCYTREEGEYFRVPKTAGRLSPFFYRNYQGTCYARYTDDLLNDEPKWKEYALAVLGEFLN